MERLYSCIPFKAVITAATMPITVIISCNPIILLPLNFFLINILCEELEEGAKSENRSITVHYLVKEKYEEQVKSIVIKVAQDLKRLDEFN